MIKIQNKVENSQLPQQRQRLKIDQQLKLNFIRSVINDHLPVYQAAKLHKLKYSSAKYVFRNYQRDTNSFFSKQRRLRIMCICQNIIIDVSIRKIKLFELNNALKTNFKERIINSLNNQISPYFIQITILQNKQCQE